MQKIKKNYRLIIASTKDSKEKFHRLKSNSDFTSNVIAYRIIFVRGGPNSIAKMAGLAPPVSATVEAKSSRKLFSTLAYCHNKDLLLFGGMLLRAFCQKSAMGNINLHLCD